MSPNRQRSTPPRDVEQCDCVGRRRFLGLGAALGAAAVAGCTGSVPSSMDGGSTTQQLGTFRLLISDQPVAIEDFDSLVVHFQEARVFRADGEDDDDEDEPAAAAEAEQTDTEEPTDTPESTQGSPADSVEGASQEQDDDMNDAEDDQEGFVRIDLTDESADLTNLVGEKALPVSDVEIPAARYAKIELQAASVEGKVDEDTVDVKIPGEKLQIVKPFEVNAGETVSFVFDINVVKKGPSGGYNLLPVIAKSGVAGEDVEVQEVDAEGNPVGASDVEDTEETDTETEDGAEQGGPPDDVPAGDQPTETASPEA